MPIESFNPTYMNHLSRPQLFSTSPPRNIFNRKKNIFFVFKNGNFVMDLSFSYSVYWKYHWLKTDKFFSDLPTWMKIYSVKTFKKIFPFRLRKKKHRKKCYQGKLKQCISIICGSREFPMICKNVFWESPLDDCTCELHVCGCPHAHDVTRVTSKMA